ncbi:ribosome biogenesis regulatory protein homolog [Tubulanus polymorphus]|uniref:ribosome biogenesis regulatory protein homolog n=1 Tax=Tubulanus polymorphus TaxID=672921 RepID=UPI003DA44FBB
MEVVENVLAEIEERDAKYKSTEVTKDIDLEIDEGNLLAVDANPLNLYDYRKAGDRFLKDLARDNTQLLLNSIWQLPVETVEDVVVAKLPEPKMLLPREKPAPKEKPLTKWQEFAKMKGINSTKKSRMVWDDSAQEWKPRWGYKRANDDTKDWLIEIPDHKDPMEDQFAKRKHAKSERVAKNELHRLRNIARSQKRKVPGVGLTPTDNPNKDHVKKALALAKKSTASIGKFTENLPHEKPAKNTGKRRKFEPNIGASFNDEKTRNLNMLRDLKRNKPVFDVKKATNQHLNEADLKRHRQKMDAGDGDDASARKKPKAGKRGKKIGGGSAGKKRGGKIR